MTVQLAELHLDAVARQDANEELAHLARHMGQDHVVLAALALPISAWGGDAPCASTQAANDLRSCCYCSEIKNILSDPEFEGVRFDVTAQADGTAYFVDSSVGTGLGTPSHNFTGFGTSWIDFDNDGWLDVLVVNGSVYDLEPLVLAGDPYALHQTNLLFRNREGRFEEITARGGGFFRLSEVSRGLAVGDVDNDGDMDAAVGTNNGPARLLLNVTDGGASWRKLENGLPSGDVGRIGLAMSPVDPDLIYAIVEAQRDEVCHGQDDRQDREKLQRPLLFNQYRDRPHDAGSVAEGAELALAALRPLEIACLDFGHGHGQFQRVDGQLGLERTARERAEDLVIHHRAAGTGDAAGAGAGRGRPGSGGRGAQCGGSGVMRVTINHTERHRLLQIGLAAAAADDFPDIVCSAQRTRQRTTDQTDPDDRQGADPAAHSTCSSAARKRAFSSPIPTLTRRWFGSP